MPGRITYRPDNESFGKFMVSGQMRDVTVEVCRDIAKRAGVYAPRRKSGVTPPGEALADNFKVNSAAGVLVVAGNPRVKVEVYNSKRSAAPNEFGSKRNPRHRMLGRAGADFGDFKPDGGLHA